MRFVDSWAWRTLMPALLASGLLLSCRASYASETWADYRVAGPFVCRADFPLDGMEALLGDLAQLQDDLIRQLGVPSADPWIELYLFRDETTYREYLAYHFPKVPYRRALYLRNNGPGVVLAYRSRELAVDLRHECTHALLHAVLPMVPLWLDEGLAEYFEVAPAKRAFENPHLAGVRWKARLGMAPQMESLERVSSMSGMRKTEYRDAWAWVHFMFHGSPEAHDELRRYLADIQASTPPGDLSTRLGGRISGPRQQFTTHFRSWKP